MKYDAVLPAVRCEADEKDSLERIATDEGVPLSIIQRRAIRVFLAQSNTQRIGKVTERHNQEETK